MQFKNPRYIGDPINAVRIFNDLKADELVFLDILASRENRTISLDFVKDVGEEANMPFAAGGGAGNLQHMQQAYHDGHATALAAGSLFVYHGARNAVLVNYPDLSDIFCIFAKKSK